MPTFNFKSKILCYLFENFRKLKVYIKNVSFPSNEQTNNCLFSLLILINIYKIQFIKILMYINVF